jgi:hypothetical protein
LPDFLEVTEEHHRRILDVSVRAIAIAIGTGTGTVAHHTPLAVEVLALQSGLDFALDDVDSAGRFIVVVVVVVAVITTGNGLPAEARGFGADFGTDGLV